MRQIVIRHGLFFAVKKDAERVFLKECKGDWFKFSWMVHHKMANDWEALAGPIADCKPECHWCCYLKTDVTVLELWIALAAVERHPRRDDLIKKIKKADAITRGMTCTQRAEAQLLCPLCVSRCCSIYAMRPISCLVYHSTSAKTCTADYNSCFDGSVDLMHNSDLHTIAGAVAMGTNDVLESAGLENGLYELNAALAIALATDEPVRRWLNCERFLSDAEANQDGLVQSLIQLSPS
jgi:hypothetical protein